jgi:hypothetical protein
MYFEFEKPSRSYMRSARTVRHRWVPRTAIPNRGPGLPGVGTADAGAAGASRLTWMAISPGPAEASGTEVGKAVRGGMGLDTNLARYPIQLGTAVGPRPIIWSKSAKQRQRMELEVGATGSHTTPGRAAVVVGSPPWLVSTSRPAAHAKHDKHLQRDGVTARSTACTRAGNHGPGGSRVRRTGQRGGHGS